MLKKRGISFSFTKNAGALIQKKGISREYGAREVDRVIRNDIKPLLVDDILFGKLKDGGEATLDSQDEGFVIQI